MNHVIVSRSLLFYVSAVLMYLGNPMILSKNKGDHTECLAAWEVAFLHWPTNRATILHRPFPWPSCEKPSEKPYVSSWEEDSESLCLVLEWFRMIYTCVQSLFSLNEWSTESKTNRLFLCLITVIMAEWCHRHGSADLTGCKMAGNWGYWWGLQAESLFVQWGRWWMVWCRR